VFEFEQDAEGGVDLWNYPGFSDSLICPRFCGVGVLESGCLGGGVEGFVFGRGAHAEGAVASAGVVPVLDVVVDGGRELDAGLPAATVEQLDLHAPPERFDHRVVVGAADRSHRWRQPSVANVVAEGPGGELHAAVGAYDEAILPVAASDRHPERVEHECRGLGAVDRPAGDEREKASSTMQQ
jgi:hypothetical protein